MKLKARVALKPGECTVVGCTDPHAAFGFCKAHRAELAAAFDRANWGRHRIQAIEDAAKDKPS